MRILSVSLIGVFFLTSLITGPLHADYSIPTFLIIGTQKGGTTSLWYYLSNHPLITPYKMKEIHFFSAHYEKGIAWYLSHFPDVQSNITFEASTSYLHSFNAPKLLSKHFPKMKMIVLLRNPVDRFFSAYKDNRRSRFYWMRVKGEIEKEFAFEMEHIDEEMIRRDPKKARHLYYGLYSLHLENWLKYFPKEQILILISEKFYQDPEESLRCIYEFLNLPPHYDASYKVYNRSKDHSSLNPEIRTKLEEFYRPYNEDLEILLKREFGIDISSIWDYSPMGNR